MATRLQPRPEPADLPYVVHLNGLISERLPLWDDGVKVRELIAPLLLNSKPVCVDITGTPSLLPAFWSGAFAELALKIGPTRVKRLVTFLGDVRYAERCLQAVLDDVILELESPGILAAIRWEVEQNGGMYDDLSELYGDD